MIPRIAMLAASLLLGSFAAASPREDRTCQQRNFTAGADVLFYESCGSGSVVVIVPGGPGLDAAYMLPVARWLAADGRRAVLLEPRGTGASRAAISDGSRLTVAGSIADIEALRRSLGAERITILGHSFGGATAQAYAAAHPGQVEKLILLDSTGPDLRPKSQPLDGWRKYLKANELIDYDKARARGDLILAMKIKFLASFYHRDRGAAFVAEMPDSTINPDVAPLTVDYRKSFDVTRPGGRSDYRVVIVAGEIDWIRDSEPALRAAYPKARVLIVPHAGHFPWADAPSATRRALKAALSPEWVARASARHTIAW